MKHMTSAELLAIRARCEAATPGPWIGGRDADLMRPLYVFNIAVPKAAYDLERDHWSQHDLNADFIAHARADIPALLDEVMLLMVEKEALRKALAEHIAPTQEDTEP